MMGIDIYFDMDGTLAYFNNRICSIEDLLEPNYFYNLAPIENMVQCMNILLASHEKDVNIYILSSCINENAKQQKDRWLDKHIPLLKKEDRIYVPFSKNKADYVKNKDNLNILIDDYNSNLVEFNNQNKNFVSIKAVNDINDVHGTWKGERLYYTQSPFSLMVKIRHVFIEETCKLCGITPFSSIGDRANNCHEANKEDTLRDIDKRKESFKER